MRLIIESKYDEPTKQMLLSVYEGLVLEVRSAHPAIGDEAEWGNPLACAILDLASTGQRDPKALKLYARWRASKTISGLRRVWPVDV